MRKHFISTFKLLCILSLLISLSGCSSMNSTQKEVTWGVLGVTALAARTPAQEIEQIYYLGVFDPQEQVPPMVYRIRVHGQASILSGLQFGSGWVPAEIIDSLGSNISFKDGNIKIEKAGEGLSSSLTTGRRLVMFGPEGFREAPANHRLVIVMGSSPEDFFNAMDRSLGLVSKNIQAQRNIQLTQLLLGAQSDSIRERKRLNEVKRDTEQDLVLQEGGAK